MSDSQEKINIRKEKIKGWLKDPTNLVLVLVLIFAFVIRLYYFNLTKTQPLWWDEASYGSLAKNYITHMWDGTGIIMGETIIRPPLLPILWSILMRIGIEEVGTRFLLEFIPSILAVFFVYLVGKEAYSKRAGIFSAFIFSSLWIHLFYTGRILTNVPALPFLFASVYFMIKSTKHKFNSKFFAISLFLLSIGTLIRYPVGIVFLAYFAFLIGTRNFKLIKNTKFWFSGIMGILPMLLFFLFNLTTKGNIFPALIGGDAAETVKPEFAFHILNFIPTYLTTAFFVFFLFGVVIALFELLVGFDLINKNNKLKGHLILIIALVAIYSYFIFYIRAAEDRWLFPASLSLVCLAGFGLDYAYGFIKKYNKYIALVLVLGILLFGTNAQLKVADPLIKDRKGSFLQLRQGFEWIKENTPEDSVILGQGIQVYAVYYAERMYEVLPEDVAEVNEIEADYLVVHIFSGQPPYINDYLIDNQDKWEPVNGFFLDSEQTQPAFVIYKSTQQ